jgi:hypothetical protein
VSKQNINPICNTCKNRTVIANAGMFADMPYFYCRTCKAEVSEYGNLIQPEPKAKPEEATEAPPTEEAGKTPPKEDSLDYEQFMMDNYPYWF